MKDLITLISLAPGVGAQVTSLIRILGLKHSTDFDGYNFQIKIHEDDLNLLKLSLDNNLQIVKTKFGDSILLIKPIKNNI